MMTDPSLDRKRRRITYTASPQGVEKAENALKRLGFESKVNFAKSQLLSRSTVTKFFQREPIQLDSFKRICKALKLNWGEIAGIIEEEKSERLEIKNCSTPDINEGVEPVQTLRRQVTVIEKQSKTVKAIIVLEGDIDSINNDLLVCLEFILRRYSGDTIKITDIKEGSIRLIVEGSQEDIQQLLSLIESRELTEVNNFPIKGVQILGESSDDDENAELNNKWRLISEIVSQPVNGRNLIGADLSDADLSNAYLLDANLSNAYVLDADLSNADLRRVNLSNADLRRVNLSNTNLLDANLSNADLRGVNLRWADLRGVNFSNANLRNADLSGVNLSDANLSGVNLSGANLSDANLTRTNLRFTRINEATKLDDKWLLVVMEIFGRTPKHKGFRRAKLSGVDLSNADLRYVNLSGSDLSDTKLSNADLRGADLSSSDLRGVNLSDADLSRANVSRADLRGVILRDANLRDANLRDANLSGANLSDANFENAIVNNALFTGSIGLAEDVKRNLERRGAIFDDRPTVLAL